MDVTTKEGVECMREQIKRSDTVSLPPSPARSPGRRTGGACWLLSVPFVAALPPAVLSQVINLAAICNPSEYIKQPVNTINSNFTDAQARRLPPNQPDLSQTGAAPRANAAADIARLRSRAPLPPLS